MLLWDARAGVWLRLPSTQSKVRNATKVCFTLVLSPLDEHPVVLHRASVLLM